MSTTVNRHDAAIAFIVEKVEPPAPFGNIQSQNPFNCDVCRRAQEYSEAVQLAKEHPGGKFETQVYPAKMRLAKAVAAYQKFGLPCGYYPKEAPPYEYS